MTNIIPASDGNHTYDLPSLPVSNEGSPTPRKDSYVVSVPNYLYSSASQSGAEAVKGSAAVDYEEPIASLSQMAHPEIGLSNSFKVCMGVCGRLWVHVRMYMHVHMRVCVCMCVHACFIAIHMVFFPRLENRTKWL